MGHLQSPVLLSADHAVQAFDCGEPSLNNWLKTRALKNKVSGASRCFVICDEKKVIGFYSLSAGAVARHDAPKNMQRNMPDTLPVLVLGRLGIHTDYHNQGLGSALLRDAMLRAVNVSADAGIFAVLIHALSSEAKQFYLSRGFVESPIQPMTLFMTVATIREILSEK